MNVLSMFEAQRLGHTNVYFSFDCVGDTILLMTALEHLYIKTGKRILVGAKYIELLENCPYIDVLDGFYEDGFNDQSFNELKKHNINPIFISASNFVIENGKIRPSWGEQHILVNVCNKLGIESDVEVRTKMFLSEKEKEYGRFFKNNQVAVISTGVQKYKSIPFKTTQDVVNSLNSLCNFVQIGHVSDPLLDGVLDKRSEGGLRENAAILYNSDVFLGGIGGLMHMARSVDCRAVIGYTCAEPLHLEDYACNINVFTKRITCKSCGDNEKFPYLIKCQNNFSCISGIDSLDLSEAVQKQLSKKRQKTETAKACTNPRKTNGVEDYLKRFGKIPKKY